MILQVHSNFKQPKMKLQVVFNLKRVWNEASSLIALSLVLYVLLALLLFTMIGRNANLGISSLLGWTGKGKSLAAFIFL